MNKLTIKEFNEQVESLKINNDNELENANFLAKECNRLIKEVKASHKEAIALYHKLHKEAKEIEKEELKPLENAKIVLKNAIGDYMKIVEQRQLELAKEQEEANEVEVIAPQPHKLNGTHIRKIWKARVIDESKVPILFKNHMIRPVDFKMLNEIAKYSEGMEEIPGIEFYQEETVVIR